MTVQLDSCWYLLAIVTTLIVIIGVVTGYMYSIYSERLLLQAQPAQQHQAEIEVWTQKMLGSSRTSSI